MNDIKLKEFNDENGEKQVVAMEKFIITSGRKIFEAVDGKYKECTADDEETAFLKKYTAPAKVDDIVIGDER